MRHQLRNAGLSEEVIETAGPAYILKRDKVWIGLSVDGDGLAVEHWQRKQALTLLKYLTHYAGRAVHRERLIEQHVVHDHKKIFPREALVRAVQDIEIDFAEALAFLRAPVGI